MRRSERLGHTWQGGALRRCYASRNRNLPRSLREVVRALWGCSTPNSYCQSLSGDLSSAWSGRSVTAELEETASGDRVGHHRGHERVVRVLAGNERWWRKSGPTIPPSSALLIRPMVGAEMLT
jgi:hypothetical protein